MRLKELLLLPSLLIADVLARASPISDEYDEHLHLKPLPGGYLYAGFNFTATTALSDYESQHFRFFPRSLGQILQYTHTDELHLRFAAGRWDDETWGSRPRNGTREGGTGVELWAWIEKGQKEDDIQERWSGLVNSLSGLFCASLNFIDGTKTTKPVISFDREGTEHSRRNMQLLHGVLPHEVVCTENLTPLLKLLPCKGKKGISSLLDGHKVFDANWQTMSIDVRPVCSTGEDCTLEVQQTVDMVLDIDRAMRPRDDPIPRPPPIEEIECDQTKEYNAEDTCYPRRSDDEKAWSLSRIFGQSLKGSCHLSSSTSSRSDITLEVSSARTVEVVSESKPEERREPVKTEYTLAEDGDLDLSLPRQSLELQQQPAISPPLLYAKRQMTGYGQQRGGMHATLRNPQPTAQRVIYMESLPWFLRPYMHTLKVTGANLEKMYLTPAVDRERGTKLELMLEIPAYATVDLTYDIEKALLRYTEYPPDANRGFDIAAAVVRILPAKGSSDSQGSYVRTTSLLLPLPTPDFSMPYNVIILTSTVIALGFGSIFNLLVRRFVLVGEVPESPLAAKAKQVRDVVRAKIAAMKGKENKSHGKAADRNVTANGHQKVS